MTDTLVELATVAGLVGLLIGLIGYGWMRRRYAIPAAINCVVALGILLASARHLDAAIRYHETPMLALFAFEVSVAASFALLLFGIRVPAFVIALQAAINILLLGLLAVFLFSFKFNRLF